VNQPNYQQGGYPPQQGYQGGPPQGYQGGPPQGYQGGPPQGYQGGPPQGYQGGPPQGGDQGAPQEEQKAKREVVSVAGIPRDQRPRQAGEELRARYKDASRECDARCVGDWPGVVHYSAMKMRDDGSRELLLGLGVELPDGPRSWMFSVNIDKVPHLFWEAVDAVLGDIGDQDITEGLFAGRAAVCCVRPGSGDYADNYRVRYMKAAGVGQPQQPPRPQQPPQGYAPQGGQPQQPSHGYSYGYGGPPQQGYQGAPPQQGYQGAPPQQGYQGAPPQGAQHAPPGAGTAPAGYVPGFGQTYGPPQGQGGVQQAMGVRDEDLPF